MNNKKPSTYRDLSDSGSGPSSTAGAVQAVMDSLEQKKGDMLSDSKFLENILRQCLDNPDGFEREKIGEPSASVKKVERHSLRGRTNKTKFIIWLSDIEKEQLESLVRHRGDRSPSDLVNQMVCLALGALRSI